jgi:hypothetical protein
MKRFIVGLACLALMAMSCIDATAGTWLSNNRAGGISGSFAAISPNLGDMTVPISVTTFSHNNSPSSRTGAFDGISEPGELVWSGTYNFDAFGLTVGDAYVFTSLTFGTFSGTVAIEGGFNQSGLGSGNRTIDLTGTFTPGSNAHYEGDTTTLSGATLQIAFSRNAGESVSASWSMDTTGAKPVPEPASIAISGLGALGVAGRRFRRK